MMKPEDVPDELQALAEAQRYGEATDTYTWHRVAEAVLAAVLPAHEAMVRAKVAEEIEAAADKINDDDPGYNGMMAAAEIARGDS